MQRSINAKAKADLMSNIIVWDFDIRCFRGHCLSNNTVGKVLTSERTVKDSCFKKPKAKKAKSARTNTSEPSEHDKKCNAVATKITWLHLSTGIPLSLPIAFTYQLISIGLLLGITIRIFLLIGNRLPTSHSHQPSSYFVGTRFSSFVSLPVSYRNVVWVKSETSSNVAWAYPASGEWRGTLWRKT